GGTETSRYLHDKKTRVIPQVGARERGTDQTRTDSAERGWEDRAQVSGSALECCGQGGHRGCSPPLRHGRLRASLPGRGRPGKSRLNLAGPSAKAEYSPETDSAIVP